MPRKQRKKRWRKLFKILKMEIEAIKKTQMEGILEMDNLGKQTGTMNARIPNRIWEIKEKISDPEDTIEETDWSVRENVKSKKCLTQSIQEIWDTMKRLNKNNRNRRRNTTCWLRFLSCPVPQLFSTKETQRGLHSL